MPLSGAIQADFGALVEEAQKASAALGVMDAEAKKTGVTLAKTGQTVDGFGKEASFSQLSTGMKSVDAMANAMGVSLAKPIAAVEELGKVSGMTYAQLGLLGSAGVAVGVAVSGIALGKFIADLTNMNQVMTNLQDTYMPWIAETDRLANKQAVLDLAFQRTGKTFYDVAEAQAALNKLVKENTAILGTATHRQAEWEKEIRNHRAELPAMTAALENHTASVKQLHEQYGISTDALTYYLAKTKDQTAAQDEATRKAEAAAAAQQKLKDSMFGGDSITKANEMAAALGGVGSVSRMTTEEQAKLNTAVGEAIETYKRWGDTAPAALNEIYLATLQLPKVVSGLGSEFASLGTKFTPSADAIIADTKRMSAETAAYEAETQALAQAWQQVPPPVQQSTAAVQQMTVAMQDFGRVNRTAYESIKAGEELMRAYAESGVAMGVATTLGGYQFQRQLRTNREPNPDYNGSGQWGNTLNVNVNSTEAGDISQKLVEEMRRNGVRF
jgi:adenosyl cobinamide kinase/adenosyl cobinamide phosphate guanylyltransferase